MDGIGTTLRSARLKRGESLAQCSLAIGIGPLFLAALEDEQHDSLPATANRRDMLTRYALYLGLDPAIAADRPEVADDDSDAITQEIPIVRPPVKRDSTLAWVGGGAAIGLVGLIALGGGLGSGDTPTSPPAQPTTPKTTTTAHTSVPTTPTTTSADPGSPPVLRPTPPTTAAINLTLNAKTGKTVWVEVRRGDARGQQIFAGIVGGTVQRAIKSAKPLWLGVAWAPNLAVTLNGEVIDAQGGTESYTVTAQGLTKLGSSETTTP